MRSQCNLDALAVAVCVNLEAGAVNRVICGRPRSNAVGQQGAVRGFLHNDARP